LIGTSAFGLGDNHATPFGIMPGVEMHAQILENVLTGKNLTLPSWMLGAQALGIIVALAALSFVMLRLSARTLGLLTVAILAVISVGGWALFRYMSLLVDPVYPAAVIAVFIAVITLLKYGYSEAQRKRIRRVFDPTPIQKA
jgi:adenylate cyclase